MNILLRLSKKFRKAWVLAIEMNKSNIFKKDSYVKGTSKEYLKRVSKPVQVGASYLRAGILRHSSFP
jgi:hypothetical protein